MAKVEKQYVKECDCPEIQKGWKPQDGDNVFVVDEIMRVGRPQLYWLENYGNGSKCGEWVGYYDESDSPNWYGKKVIFLPSLEQLLDILGKKFVCLYHNNLFKYYSCFTIKERFIPAMGSKWIESKGKTRKLACLLAVKEVLREDAQEERDLVMQTRPFVKRALKKEESDE